MIDLGQWQKQEYTGMKPGLSRIRRFLKCFGDPQRSFKTVHIAGTNGKGSTTAMIASVLCEAGYKTGLYTSPHLCNIRERVKLNGHDIPDAAINRISKRLSGPAQAAGLSYFEFITAVAFIYFDEEKADIAVLETGLGGRLDATNVVQHPLVSVITGIDHDHTKLLGTSLGRIAGEKAGIIKSGVPVICGHMTKAALDVIKAKACSSGSQVFVAGKDFLSISCLTNWNKGFQVVKYTGPKWDREFVVGLVGKFQALNAGTALAAAEVLNTRGLKISAKAVQAGLLKVSWPARFQIVRRGQQLLIIDGAHNPGAMRKLVETFNGSPWAGCKPHIMYGSVKDKDYTRNISILSKIAGNVVVTALDTPRTASAAELCIPWLKKGITATRAASAKDALSKMKSSKVCLVAGSLFLAGEILNILNLQGR